MSTIPTFYSTDQGSTVKTKLETALSNLNTDKIEAGTTVNMTNKTLTSPVINAGVSGTAIDTDGTLAANSDTKIASQKAVKTYADTKLGNGWISADAMTYSSADGSTAVVNVASDVTGKYSPGMRLSYQQDQPLTSYWSFDTNSNDQVGANNGTDTAMTYTAGKFGNAATFNGTTSKIVLADAASLKPTGEFTIGCWFKTSATGAEKVLFSSYSNNTNVAGFRVGVYSDNKLRVIVGKNTGTVAGVDFTLIRGNTVVTDGVSHYLVVSFRNNYIQIFLDGKLEASGYCMTPVYAATNYVRIGCESDSGTDALFWNGQIDDLFLINGYALDEKTIAAKYAANTAQGTGAITVTKYGLITSVGAYSGGNTPITFWGGTDYSTPNTAISNPVFSSVKAPFGFPLNPTKWAIVFSDSTDRSQASPTAATWYNLGSQSITIPIGIWEVYYKVLIGADVAIVTARVDSKVTLSTSNNSESDNELSSFALGSSPGTNAFLANSTGTKKIISLVSKTVYYLNTASLGGVTVSNIYNLNNGCHSVIRATSLLL